MNLSAWFIVVRSLRERVWHNLLAERADLVGKSVRSAEKPGAFEILNISLIEEPRAFS